MIGLYFATRIVPLALHLAPPGTGIPLPTLSPAVLAEAFACAALVALASAILPALRLKRLDVATILSGR